MIKPCLIVILTILLLKSFALKSNVNGFWQLSIDKCSKPSQIESKKYNVTIPSTLHLDLLKQNQIPDPFFGNNYPSLKWVSDCSVTYMTNLTFSDDLFNHQHIQIVFEGIDTYSTILLNKKEILTTKNAFVEQRVQINKEDILRNQNNTLQVKIRPTRETEDPADRTNKMPFIYAHTRKPCYQYSWDWAPYLNTMGVWKPVYINAYDQIKMNYVWARNKAISQSEATINFAISLNVPQQSGLISDYSISVNDQNGNQASAKVQGLNVYFDLTIAKPKLWWPNGIGQPYIYDFLVKLKKGSVVLDDRKIPYGIKTAKLEQKNNEFTVILNGYPVYCKGANYVPPDMFYPRLTNPDFVSGNTIESLLNDAVQSNFNMIRLWGGGQYESDKFLQMASRKGIMIFYDFMFSDSIYPSNEEFLINVEQQVKQQIRRVRNYPCLVLWSGNNQILQGIYSWGWGRDNYRKDYHKLFEWLIVEVLKKQNPQISYIPSSPVNGVGNGGFSKGGDIHFWGVWAGGSNFQAYKTALGPFNSEFGTQSLPVWETIKQFTEPSQRSYESASFAAHERHGSKFRTLQKYHQTYAHTAKNFEMQAYMSGLVQAFGIQIAIKYQRAAKPKSYGTLYWQFNDAWPAISWSSIDYYGRWKPLQFMAKRLYPNVAIFCLDGVVKAINDNLYPVDAIAIVKVMSFSGQMLSQKQHEIRLQINEVKKVMDLDPSSYQEKKNQIVVHMEIVAGRKQEMVSTFFYYPFKELQLPKAKLFVTYDVEFNLIKVSTDKFIKNLFIGNTQEYVKLSNNYFDLVAHKEMKVTLLPSKVGAQVDLAKLKSTMKYRGYRQIHEDQELQVVVVNG